MPVGWRGARLRCEYELAGSVPGQAGLGGHRGVGERTLLDEAAELRVGAVGPDPRATSQRSSPPMPSVR